MKKEKPKVEGLAPGFVQLTRQVDDITSFADAEGQVGLLAATMDGLYRTFDDSKGWQRVSIERLSLRCAGVLGFNTQRHTQKNTRGH